jgi:hypothetical protein
LVQRQQDESAQHPVRQVEQAALKRELQGVPERRVSRQALRQRRETEPPWAKLQEAAL